MLEFFVEQLVFNTLGNELREIFGVASLHFFLRHFLAQHFAANGVHQQARSGVGVVRIFFNQRAGSENCCFINFVYGYAVIQVAHCFGNDGRGLDVGTQIGAARLNQCLQVANVQRHFFATVHDVDQSHNRCLCLRQQRTLLGAFFSVQHIGARNFVVAATHQTQLSLVLHVFNVEGAATWA